MVDIHTCTKFLAKDGLYQYFIMCAQYIGGWSVGWGDIMAHLRGYHEKIGDVSAFEERYREYVGGYNEYFWKCLVHWRDIVICMGDIMSTLGLFSTLEEYHWDTMIPVREVNGKSHLFYMEDLNIPMISLPHELWYPPMYSRYSLMYS